MSSEIPPERSALRTAGSTPPAERRAEQHPTAISVFGGSRAVDKSAGIAPGPGIGQGVVWFAFIAFSLAIWPVSKGLVIKPGSGLGYYFGLVGGVMMLLMLLYPIRKHVRWARNWGSLRYWFMLHMVLGIGGPVLILLHSTFHVKSLNAGVAFYSMLLVALSGIVGRFIYKRIHIGLYGRKSSLEELQQAVDLSQVKENRAVAILIEATGIGDKLKQFRETAFTQELTLSARAWRFMTFDWRRIMLAKHSHHELWLGVIQLANVEGWDKQQQDEHFREALGYVKKYLTAVQRAAQFTAFERLFRWWHILHTPFVWLLGISGIVHVIAVNMY